MIDALLYATRDAIRTIGYGYGVRECEIMVDGHPPPRCGDVFVAIHEMASTSDMDNALDERFAYGVTLTMRVTNTSLDRVGDTLLARKLARKVGFNARAEQLRAFLHMNWGILGDANNLINELTESANVVYGFVEPARYRGMEAPIFVGGEWFSADPSAEDVGLKSELRFEGARRLQPIALFN